MRRDTEKEFLCASSALLYKWTVYSAVDCPFSSESDLTRISEIQYIIHIAVAEMTIAN